VARGNGGAGEADGVARMVGPKVAPLMIRRGLMGDFLLAPPQAQAPVVLGGCGPEVPPVAASFPASWVGPGVSVVG